MKRKLLIVFILLILAGLGALILKLAAPSEEKRVKAVVIAAKEAADAQSPTDLLKHFTHQYDDPYISMTKVELHNALTTAFAEVQKLESSFTKLDVVVNGDKAIATVHVDSTLTMKIHPRPVPLFGLENDGKMVIDLEKHDGEWLIRSCVRSRFIVGR